MVPLVFNVFADSKLIDANGGNKVASTPKAAGRNLFGLFLEPSRAFALENAHHIGYGELWGNGNIEMDVLVSHVPSNEPNVLPTAN